MFLSVFFYIDCKIFANQGDCKCYERDLPMQEGNIRIVDSYPRNKIDGKARLYKRQIQDFPFFFIPWLKHKPLCFMLVLNKLY